MAEVESPYLTPDEAAAYLRYPTAQALRVDIQKKQIPYIRRGRRSFFVKASLDEFMARIASDSKPQTPAIGDASGALA